MAGISAYGCLVVRLMSLTEKGNENHSQAKAKGKAPVVGAGEVSWSASGWVGLCLYWSEPYGLPPAMP